MISNLSFLEIKQIINNIFNILKLIKRKVKNNSLIYIKDNNKKILKKDLRKSSYPKIRKNLFNTNKKRKIMRTPNNIKHSPSVLD